MDEQIFSALVKAKEELSADVIALDFGYRAHLLMKEARTLIELQAKVVTGLGAIIKADDSRLDRLGTSAANIL